MSRLASRAARPWPLAGALALVTSVAAASPPADPNGGPTGAGRLRIADPLDDPAWRRDARTLGIATGTLGAFTVASWTGFAVARTFALHRGPAPDNFGVDESEPGYEEARLAMFSMAFLHGAVALSLIAVAAIRDRHLDLATLAVVPDLRADAVWRARDRRLTRGVRASGAVAGVAGVGFTIAYNATGDGPGAFWPDIAFGLIGGSSLIVLAVLGAQRRRHRARLDRWPRLASGGLSWQF